MPAIAALVLADGQTTPANHTFAPVTTTGSHAEFADRAPASPAGYLGIIHEIVKPSTPTAAYRVKMGFNLPVLATVGGVPTVVRNSSAQVIFNFAQLSTEQERKDALAYVKNMLANASVVTSIKDIEPFY